MGPGGWTLVVLAFLMTWDEIGKLKSRVRDLEDRKK
jgi:hypothetical protein